MPTRVICLVMDSTSPYVEVIPIIGRRATSARSGRQARYAMSRPSLTTSRCSLRTGASRSVFGLCGHTNISLIAALERHGARALHHHPARTGGRPRRRRLRPCVRTARRRAAPRWTRHHERDDRRRHGSLRLGAAPRHRGRRAVLLRGARTAPGVQPARDADQASVYEPFVKRAWRARRADQIPRILARAWDLALGGAARVRSSSRSRWTSWPRHSRRRSSRHPRVATGAGSGDRPRIAQELRTPQRPLILAGGGTRRAAAEVRELAERTGAPVAAHPDGDRGAPT